MTNGSPMSRRSVLQRGLLAGSLAVTGTATIAGSAAAKGRGAGRGVGGSGFLGDNGLDKVTSWGDAGFEVIAALDGEYNDALLGTKQLELWQAPDCANDEAKWFQGYRIRKVGGDSGAGSDNAVLYVNPNRTLNTGVTAMVTATRDGCDGQVYINGDYHGDYATNKIAFGAQQ